MSKTWKILSLNKNADFLRLYKTLSLKLNILQPSYTLLKFSFAIQAEITQVCIWFKSLSLIVSCYFSSDSLAGAILKEPVTKI